MLPYHYVEYFISKLGPVASKEVRNVLFSNISDTGMELLKNKIETADYTYFIDREALVRAYVRFTIKNEGLMIEFIDIKKFDRLTEFTAEQYLNYYPKN